MKIKFKILCLFAVLFLSCNKQEWIIDETPIFVEVSVFSGTGDNVLDENAVGCILNKEIYLSYHGVDYPLGEYFEDYVTPYPFPVLNKGTILIGSFDGERIGISTMVLHLGKAEYTIVLDNYVVKDKNSVTGTRNMHKFYLNDILVDGPTTSHVGKIKIVLNPADI